MQTWDDEKQAAIEAVIKACRLLEIIPRSQATSNTVRKGDATPVTIADFGVQALVSDHLGRAYPHVPLVGEESSDLLRTPDHAGVRADVVRHVKSVQPGLSEEAILQAIDRGSGTLDSDAPFWVLDPVDGTKGFLRGDQYAVALALVDRGHVVLGLLGCPHLPWDLREPERARGCLFVAVRGQGAAMRRLGTQEETGIQVANLTDSSQLVPCESFESSHSSHGDADEVFRRLNIHKEPVRMDSQCKYGLVARGDASLYLRLPARSSYVETIWDHAAGSLMVEEAGGRVTDLQGKALDFTTGRKLAKNRGIIATNGPFHDRVLEAVKRLHEELPHAFQPG